MVKIINSLIIKRKNIIKRRGGKLISIESYVLGFIVLFVLMMAEFSTPVSCIFAFLFGFGFPILIESFKTFVWISTVAFSLIWGIMSYIIASSIAHNSVIWGLLGGIIVFTISFLMHKTHYESTLNSEKEEVNIQQTQVTAPESNYEAVSFCPKCGRRIHSIDGKCDFCN